MLLSAWSRRKDSGKFQLSQLTVGSSHADDAGRHGGGRPRALARGADLGIRRLRLGDDVVETKR